MDRRFALRLLGAGLASAGTGCGATGALPRYTVSTERLQQAIAQRFPLRYPVAGLLELELATPQLRMRPERNRIASALSVAATGPLLARRYDGSFDLEFGLRYEPSDRTVRAHQLEVQSLRLPGLSARALELLNGYLPVLAREALGDVVLHQLQPDDLALVDGLGLQPDTLTVTAGGVTVGLAPRAGMR